MKPISISIIIPVYNVEKYIESCISSVLRQDYKGHIECIIIDDCGQDNSIQIAQNITSHAPSNIDIKYIFHKKNSGLSAARNSGIKAATGDYLFFLDSDDTLPSDALTNLTLPLKKYGMVDLVVGSTQTSIPIKSLEWLNLQNKSLPEYSNCAICIKEKLLERYTLSMTAWNKLIKKSTFINNNLYFKEGIIHEDDHWNFYLAKCIKSICITKEMTYNYTIRKNSITQAYNVDKDNQTYLNICKDWLNSIDNICKSSQISLIGSFLIPIFIFTHNKQHKKQALDQMQKLSCHIGTMAIFYIWTLRFIPRQLIIKFHLHKYLKTIFKVKI
jgi:glycosyltransferase involved in cell wall biosynthesis